MRIRTSQFDSLPQRFFSPSNDQVGLLEMNELAVKTGGVSVMGDSFSQSVFKESFRRMFARTETPGAAPGADGGASADEGHLRMGFAAEVEVTTSTEYTVMGAIGSCSSLKKKNRCVADTELGEGGTFAWRMGGITPESTLALFFEITNPHTTPIPMGKRRHLQASAGGLVTVTLHFMRILLTRTLFDSPRPPHILFTYIWFISSDYHDVPAQQRPVADASYNM